MNAFNPAEIRAWATHQIITRATYRELVHCPDCGAFKTTVHRDRCDPCQARRDVESNRRNALASYHRKAKK